MRKLSSKLSATEVEATHKSFVKGKIYIRTLRPSSNSYYSTSISLMLHFIKLQNISSLIKSQDSNLRLRVIGEQTCES